MNWFADIQYFLIFFRLCSNEYRLQGMMVVVTVYLIKVFLIKNIDIHAGQKCL